MVPPLALVVAMSEGLGREPILTVDEAAAGAGVTSAQIRAWVAEGRLPVLRTALRQSRIRGNDLAALVNDSGAPIAPTQVGDRLAAAFTRAADRGAQVNRYLDTGAFAFAALALLLVADRLETRTIHRVLEHGVIGPVAALAAYLFATVLLGAAIAMVLRRMFAVRNARPRQRRPDDSQTADGTV